MGKSCSILPKHGTSTFRQLKQNFGHKIAAEVFNRVITDKFKDKFEDTLTLDSEGIPTYLSIIQNPLVKNYIGESTILESLNKNSKTMPNTLENANILINEAARKNAENKDYITIVDTVDNNTLTLRVVKKTKENEDIARHQQAIQKLNNIVVEFLEKAGVTIEHMSSVEVAVGKVGEVNFNHAKDIANEFTGLLRVANNMQGSAALSEEFSHLLVGIYKDTPLIQRAINYLKNPDAAANILGDKYYDYLEAYAGDMDRVAEEAVGHMLREQFLNLQTEKKKVSIFQRVKDFIISKFKGINPGHYKDSIDSVAHDLSKFAEDIIARKKVPTKEQIVNSARNTKFNALSEKGKQQAKVLRMAAQRLHKEASMLQNTKDGKERSDKKKTALALSDSINKNIVKEDTMLAIAELLNTSLDELNSVYSKLGDLNELELQDKFIVLRNALRTLESNGRTINELFSVLSEDFLKDADILSQHFMIQDAQDSLKEFRASEPISMIDTSRLNQQEIARLIVNNSANIILSQDGTHYVNTKTGEKYMRTTQVIQTYSEGHTFDPNSPYIVPSTNIGTGMDELVRDFIQGRITFNRTTSEWEVEGESLDKVYPNANKEDLNLFVSQLKKKIKENITDEGITLIPRDVTIEGTVNTTDGKGTTHIIQVAGTLDLLGYDQEGNWYIYDMKTHRGNINNDTKDKYARQISLYKKLLEDKYGITIKNLSIIPIKVNYPAPRGTTAGTAEYRVKADKSAKYNGRESNQLIKDGNEFKEARPFLEDFISMEESAPDVNYRKLSNDPTNGIGNAKDFILKALNNVNSQYAMLRERFYTQSLEEFVNFLIPFMGETMEVSDGKGGLKTVSIRELVKKGNRDITMMQRYFTTMADNPDGLLQAFDKIVKIQKAEQRLNTIDLSQRILALGKEYESKGITEYSWMFEPGNQHYITKLIIDNVDYSYNRSAYEEAKRRYLESLDKIYGKHPEIGSKEYSEKNKLKLQWIKDNTEKVMIDGNSTTIPNHKLYPSKWSNLPATKKEFYDKWMELKNELDALLPNGATTLTNTIKIRKQTSERVTNLLKSGDIQGIIQDAKSNFIRSFDDDYNYKGITGLNDEEVLTLPLYYLHSQNSSDITNDVIGSLIAYADMAYNYQAMQEVINPLEIGRNWVMHNRRIPQTKGGRTLKGSVNIGDRRMDTEGAIDPMKSQFGQLLDDFFESKIYEKYLIDNGEINGINVNKAAGVLLKLGSMIQLGFNTLAHAANAITGIAMQNIETVTGQFFNARELASADKNFIASLPDYLGDIGQRIPKSKLALFDEMFNVKQDFRKKQKNKDFLNKTIIGRIFGPRMQFLGQDAGDFWLYNRTAIAMAKRFKLRDANNNFISLWDALIVVPIDSAHPERGNKLVLKEGVTKEDGTEFSRFDKGEFERQIGDVNRHLFGVYNDEDSIAARRTMWGRFLMQYRDWIPSQLRYRFGTRTVNQDAKVKREGYYRTSFRFLRDITKELKNGEKTIQQSWNQLEDFEKANIKRAVAEIGQLAIVNIICFILGSKAKDKDRSWAEKTFRALMFRERTELGALTVGLSMPQEFINIIKSPVAATNITQDILNTVNVLNPVAWATEIESGPYKGQSEAYRAFVNSPITLWYKNINKTMNPDIMERYYENLK